MTAKAIEKAEKRIEKALAKIEKSLNAALKASEQNSLFGQLDFLDGKKAEPKTEAPAVDVRAFEKQIADLKDENALYLEEVERLTKELEQVRAVAKAVAVRVDGTIEEVENLMKEAA